MHKSRLQKSNRQFLWSTMVLAIMVLAMVFVMMYMASCTNNTCVATGECGDSVTTAYYSVDYFNSDGVDSVEVKDGKFTLESSADSVGFRIVQTTDGHLWMYFIEPGNVVLHSEGYVSGTPLNDAYHQFLQSIQSAKDEEECVKIFTEYISANKDNLAGVVGVLGTTDYLPISKCVPFLEMLSPELQAKVFTSVPKEEFYHVDKVKEGDMFTDFEVEYDGKVQKLSDYVGKGNYTLVDFWASWCGPCKGEIPNLKKLHEQFGDKGLTVLGVATWDKPEDTMKAIDELGITYPQIINAQSISSEAYDFKGIPMIILFDKEGRVLYKDLRGEDMVAKVSALFQ